VCQHVAADLADSWVAGSIASETITVPGGASPDSRAARQAANPYKSSWALFFLSMSRVGHANHVVALRAWHHMLPRGSRPGHLHTQRVFFGMSVCCGRFVWLHR